MDKAFRTPVYPGIPDGERCLMQNIIHKTCDKNYARRLTAMFTLLRGYKISDVTKELCCARSSLD